MSWLLFILLFGLSVYGLWNNKNGPCTTAIPYRVGSVDIRFRLNRQQIVEALQQATSVWEAAQGKPLFVYNEQRGFPVNLVYDDRQKIANLHKLNEEILKQIRQEMDSLRGQLDALKAKDPQDQDLPDQDDQRAELAERHDQYNSLVERYNSDISEEHKYLTLMNRHAGQQFIAGDFIFKDGSREINIYEFSNMHEFIEVLSHELGHALGLQHNDYPGSIMSPSKETWDASTGDDEPIIPSSEDLKELATECHS